jgi:hypothetical protein
VDLSNVGVTSPLKTSARPSSRLDSPCPTLCAHHAVALAAAHCLPALLNPSLPSTGPCVDDRVQRPYLRAYPGGLPGAEPRPSASSMPTSFAEPLLVVDVEKMQQMDIRSVETLFSMWSGK